MFLRRLCGSYEKKFTEGHVDLQFHPHGRIPLWLALQTIRYVALSTLPNGSLKEKDKEARSKEGVEEEEKEEEEEGEEHLCSMGGHAMLTWTHEVNVKRLARVICCMDSVLLLNKPMRHIWSLCKGLDVN